MNSLNIHLKYPMIYVYGVCARTSLQMLFKAFQVTRADGTEVRNAFNKTMSLAKNSLKYAYLLNTDTQIV